MRTPSIAFGAAFAALAPCAHAQPSFQHVVVVIQENRTPDNLFHDFCTAVSCGQGSGQYDIQMSGWKTKTGTMNPTPVPLTANYDLGHTHASFTTECDVASGQCQMDGWQSETCTGLCNPQKAAYGYVPNTDGILKPYFDLARQYGWANRMFQTNQGPSMPAHQYLFGATSALSAENDAAGIFMAENPIGGNGCVAPANASVALVYPDGTEPSSAYPCGDHATLTDLADGQQLSWRYYSVGAGTLGQISIWNAPVNIAHICQSTGYDGKCAGPEWAANVDLNPADVLTDIQKCVLRNVVWVTPTAANSDHANEPTAADLRGWRLSSTRSAPARAPIRTARPTGMIQRSSLPGTTGADGMTTSRHPFFLTRKVDTSLASACRSLRSRPTLQSVTSTTRRKTSAPSRVS